MKINVNREDAPVVSRDYIQKGKVYKHSHTGSKYYFAVGVGRGFDKLVDLATGTSISRECLLFDGWIEVEAEVIIK